MREIELKNTNLKKVVMVIIPLLIALISAFGVTKYASSAEFHKETIEYLDEKKTTVMEFTAVSTASSVAVSMIPGDVGTSLSDKLMDLSGYFLIVLAALYLEKYLLTITGYVTFGWLIPIACILFSLSVFWKRDMMKSIAKRLILFGVAIVLIIPTSVKVSDLIETTYEISLEETLKDARETTDKLEEGAEEEESKWKSFVSKVKGGFTGILKKMEKSLNNLMEGLVVMLVTSCLIPILVLAFFAWIMKMFLNVEFSINKKRIPKLSEHRKKVKE